MSIAHSKPAPALHNNPIILEANRVAVDIIMTVFGMTQLGFEPRQGSQRNS